MIQLCRAEDGAIVPLDVSLWDLERCVRVSQRMVGVSASSVAVQDGHKMERKEEGCFYVEDNEVGTFD